MKSANLTFSTWKKQALTNTKIKSEYLKLQPEMAVIRSMINARIAADLTQNDLAVKIGTTQSVISRLETGRGNPTVALLQKLAKAYKSKLRIEFVPE